MQISPFSFAKNAKGSNICPFHFITVLVLHIITVFPHMKMKELRDKIF